MKLIVGLGNPGQRYRGTRHNLGFDVLDRLAERWQVSSIRDRFHGRVADVRLPDTEPTLLLWPETYMNRSGLAVAEAVRWYGLDPRTDLLVTCDDLNLPLGSIRLRPKGSDGGQRGLRDVIQHLGTDQFARLRLGIGPRPASISATDFVLGRFLPDEQPAVQDMVERAADCVECWLRHGIQTAMARYNATPSRSEQGGATD